MMKESTTSPGGCVQVRVMVVVPGEADRLVGEEGMMAIECGINMHIEILLELCELLMELPMWFSTFCCGRWDVCIIKEQILHHS
jgi:hypothetical protein